MNPLIESLAVSLALTLALELLMALIWRVRGLHDFLLVLLVNVMTNPPVVLTHNLIKLEMPLLFTLGLEVAVVVLEGLCYKYSARSIKSPWWFSLTANVFSYISGLILLNVIFGG